MTSVRNLVFMLLNFSIFSPCLYGQNSQISADFQFHNKTEITAWCSTEFTHSDTIALTIDDRDYIVVLGDHYSGLSMVTIYIFVRSPKSAKSEWWAPVLIRRTNLNKVEVHSNNVLKELSFESEEGLVLMKMPFSSLKWE